MVKNRNLQRYEQFKNQYKESLNDSIEWEESKENIKRVPAVPFYHCRTAMTAEETVFCMAEMLCEIFRSKSSG